MRLLPHLVSSTLYFCTLNSQPLELLESDVVDHGHSASSLVARQAPAVVASSDFYRRAYHACMLSFKRPISGPILIEGLAAVVGNWIYIDGGEFSYRSNGNVTYQYCMLSLLLLFALYLSCPFQRQLPLPSTYPKHGRTQRSRYSPIPNPMRCRT